MVAKFLDHNSIELKQRRQRWQRERQKSNRFIMAKQQLCTCITVCCHSEILLPWQRDETTSPVYCLRRVAWDQTLQLGKKVPPPQKKKKKLANEVSRTVVWGEERVPPHFLPPQSTAQLASLADSFCAVFTPFFGIFPYSGVPGYRRGKTACELRWSIYRFAAQVFKKKLH